MRITKALANVDSRAPLSYRIKFVIRMMIAPLFAMLWGTRLFLFCVNSSSPSLRKICSYAIEIIQDKEQAARWAEKPWAKGLNHDEILREGERRILLTFRRLKSDPAFRALYKYFSQENREHLDDIDEWLLSLSPQQIQTELDRLQARN